MNAPTENTPMITIGMLYAGGIFAGNFQIGTTQYALILATKALGEHADTEWNGTYAKVEGATSFNDGMANTNAMADAGSELAKWARSLSIEGFDDWYIPSQDELEILYRNFKPTTEQNTLYGRSGVNASALPPTHPYSPLNPLQASDAQYQKDGAEAFADEWYWSSTQHAGYEDGAWAQFFDDGDQSLSHKGNRLRARAVRRLIIQ